MVPAKSQFMQITIQMFRTPKVKDSLLGPFHNGAKRFGGIAMNLTSSILFYTMIHRLVRRIPQPNAFIRSKLIGHQMGRRGHKSGHFRGQLVNTVVVNMGGPNRTAALNSNEDSLLFCSFTSWMDNPFLITGFAANVLFIQFNNAVKGWEQLITRIHHFANRVTDLPGAFLRNTNPLAKADRRDSLAGIGHQKHRQDPFPQGQFSAVHGCLAGDRKLSFALGTFISPVSAFEGVGFHA